MRFVKIDHMFYNLADVRTVSFYVLGGSDMRQRASLVYNDGTIEEFVGPDAERLRAALDNMDDVYVA